MRDDGFAAWLSALDRNLEELRGIVTRELASETFFRDWYRQGLSADEAAFNTIDEFSL